MGAKKSDGGDSKKGGDGAAATKKEESPITVVLKIEMHCEGCATKIVKTLKNFDGVDTVKPEYGAHKLTVVGKVDPSKLREKLAGKLKKKVDLISPQPTKKDDDKNNNKKTAEKAEKPKDDDKKPKEPPVTTAVLKLNLHCQGCIEKIHKIVTKTRGFHDMSIDKEKDLVTVKGAMDMKAMAEALKVRLKRAVEIVPAKKDNKDNKEKVGGGDNGGGGGKKNKEGGNAGGGGGGKIDRVEFPAGQPGFGQVAPYGFVGYDYPPPPPMMNMGNALHAPQLFSDENPNACSIM